MSRFRPRRWLPVVLCFVTLLAARNLPAVEVSPLDLLTESVAVCLEVPHPEATWQLIEKSRLAERVRAFAPFQRLLLGSGFQQWSAIENYVAQATGLPLSEQLRGLCAQSLVLAIYLPEGAKPQGMLIVRSSDEATLSRSIAALSKLEPQYINQPQQHLGKAYIKRSKSPESKQALFYVIFDQTLVLSDQEGLVQQAIELQELALARAELGASAKVRVRTLRESETFQAARKRLPNNSAAFIHVNGRAWDKTLHDGVPHDPAAAALLEVWRCVSALAGSLRFDEGLALDVCAELDRPQLPSGWAEFVRSTQATTTQASPSLATWAERIPAEALLAVSMRADVRPLVQTWLATAPDAKSKDFVRGRRVFKSLLGGRDLFEDVLPALLSNITIHASAPIQTSNRAVPFELLGQLSWPLANTATGSSQNSPTFTASLDNALQFGLNFVTSYRAHEQPESKAIVCSKAMDGVVQRWIDGLPLWEPGFAVTAEHLFIASSRAELARGLLTAEPAQKHVASPRLAEHERRFFAGTTQLVWLDSAQTRTALTKHSRWIANALAGHSENSKSEIASRLSHLQEILQLFDAAFIAGSLSDDHVRLTFGVALD